MYILIQMGREFMKTKEQCPEPITIWVSVADEDLYVE